MRHKSKFKLLFCENWKEICSGEDSYTIPEEWKFVYLNEITSSLDNIRKPLNSVERAKFKGEVPYWGANSIVDKVKAHLFDGECVLLGEDAAPFFDKSKPVAFLSKGKIWPNNHIHVLLANSQKVDSKFLTFMLNRYDYDRVIDTKIRPKLTQGMMLCMGFALPNLEEQKRVLEILSSQESILDDLKSIISLEQSRLEELTHLLLSGRFRASIQDGQVLLKKNETWKEVEVNGETVEIPEDWNVSKIGDIFKVIGGGTPSTQNDDYWGGNIPWIGPKDMSEDEKYVFASGRALSEKGAETLKAKKIKKGSLVLSTRAPVGYAKIAPYDLFTNQGCHSLVGGEFDVDFMYFWSLQNKKIYEQYSTGTTFKEISKKSLENILVSNPNNVTEKEVIGKILSNQSLIVDNFKKIQEKEQKRFEWLLDNLLSGKYLVEEVK